MGDMEQDFPGGRPAGRILKTLRAMYPTPADVATLAQRVGTGKGTTQRALVRLAGRDLVRPVGKQWIAVPPAQRYRNLDGSPLWQEW